MNFHLINSNLKSNQQNTLSPSSINTNDIINVHIIPHTHDDAGWLWTLDDYYYGTNPWGKCVKCILDNMLTSLNEDKSRTFTYVEMAFFEKWYTEQNESTKVNLKNLIKEGRLDFANGGWVMNDEAAADYQDIIDQMRIGMQFLKKELDYTPRIAWYIDPFGHSLTNSYLLSKLGFDKLVMVRIDFREKEKRIKEKTMEFLWRPYYQLDKGQSSILTHITHGHYSPDGDRFPNLLEVDYNTPELFNDKLDSIYNYFKDMSNAYPTNELMFLFGDDFTFLKANQNFNNIEAMMKAFDMSGKYKGKINFFYSTPTKYFNAIQTKLPNNLQTFDGFDFFPYSEFKMDYWTGYFTSRPYLKGLVRDAGTYLEQTNNLLVNHLNSPKAKSELEKNLSNIYALRRELGIAQHHDGVSGTAREAVSEDYINRLNGGIKKASEVVKSLIEEDLSSVVKGSFDSICIEAVSQGECLLKVYDKIQISKGILVVYINPGIKGKYPLKLKVNTDHGILIKDVINSKEIINDLICDSDLDYCVVNTIIEFSNEDSYKILLIQSNSQYSKVAPYDLKNVPNQFKLVDNEKSLLLFNIDKMCFYQKVKSTGEEYTVSITHGYYEYHSERDPMGKNRQGAYLMATDEEIPVKFPVKMEKSKVFIGKNMCEIDIVFEKSKLKFRVYHSLPDSNFIIDTESILFPNHPQEGLEFILIVESNVDNLNSSGKTEFFTDTNGMRVIKRIKDTRQTFDFQVDDKVASNFYPVNSLISLKGSSQQINVYNDRSQAGSSLNKGEVFFVMNRWSQKDDRKGLADGIDEFNSSNINFHLNHWVALTQNEFNKEFIFNLINKKPLYAVYNQENSNTSYNNQIPKQGMIKDSLFSIEDSGCIEYNFYFISCEKLLVQFLNKFDPYLYSEKSCKVEIKQNSDLISSVKRMKNLNGIDEYSENYLDIESILRVRNSRTFFGIGRELNQITNEYMIKPLDFETFMFTLKK